MAAMPASALAADPIMRLADVRAGMHCTGLSVVRGTAISGFEVEVIDVIRGDASSATAPRILVRVSGPAVDGTGVGPGFSGSPIYCPDGNGVRRNAGAISETVGEYGNKVALATPIEQILGQGPEAPRSARADAALLRRARPIAGPLTVGGLSGVLRARLSRAARRAGASVLATPSGPLSGFPKQELVPGAAVSAGFSSGDLTIGAIGTVAYRSGTAVWAFGHPLDGAGKRSLPLQDAYVFSVINNPQGSEDLSTYKLAVPGHVVGALTNDGLNAIAGRLGHPPPTIPLRVDVRDTDTNRLVSLRSDVADERDLELGSGLDLVGTLALGEAASDALGSAPPRTTSSMCLRIRVRERRRPLGFCDEYVEGGGPFDDLSSAFTLIDAFEFGRITPVDAFVRMRVHRGVREALILGARARGRARPGGRLRVTLLVQRRRGGRQQLSFHVRVPRSLRPGPRLLRLRGVVPQSMSDGSEDGLALLLEALGPGSGDVSSTGTGPVSVSELAAKIAALGRPDGLHATFRSKGRGPVVLPTSRLLLRGEVTIPVRVVGRGRK